MKSYLAKVSLALLSAGFLLGCQDQGSGPVGPEGLGPEFAKVKNCDPPNPHPSCKDGDAGDNSTALVALIGGFNTGTGQTATVQTDSRTRLKLFNASEAFETDINLSNTMELADADGCTVKNNGGDLAQYLDQSLAARNFSMEFDKKATTSNRHSLGVNWLNADGLRIRVGLKANISGFPELSVTTTALGGGSTQYTFTQGAVNVQRLVGGVKQMDELFCPNLDEVIVTVTR